MSKNFTRRYSIKASMNAILGLSAGAASYYFGSYAYNNGKLFLTTHFGNKSLTKILETAEATSNEYFSNKCLKKAELKTTATTNVPQYDEAVYIQCMKAEYPPQSVVIGVGISVFFGIHAFKAIRRAISYGSLAHQFSKSDHQDIEFRLLDKTEDVQVESSNHGSSNHRFHLTNGITASATIILQPQEKVQSGRGALLAKSSDIHMNAEATGASSTNKKKDLLGRIASGEGLLRVIYTNTSDVPQTLMLSPPNGQQLTAINLDKGVSIFCDNGAFFASSAPVNIKLKPIKNLAFQTFGGQGVSFQHIGGLEDSTSVLLASKGTIIPYKLAEGESLDVQKGSLFALTGNVTLRLKEISGAFNRMASGEKGFMTSVSGPGTVWIIARAQQHDKNKHGSSLLDILKPGN